LLKAPALGKGWGQIMKQIDELDLKDGEKEHQICENPKSVFGVSII